MAPAAAAAAAGEEGAWPARGAGRGAEPLAAGGGGGGCGSGGLAMVFLKLREQVGARGDRDGREAARPRGGEPSRAAAAPVPAPGLTGGPARPAGPRYGEECSLAGGARPQVRGYPAGGTCPPRRPRSALFGRRPSPPPLFTRSSEPPKRRAPLGAPSHLLSAARCDTKVGGSARSPRRHACCTRRDGPLDAVLAPRPRSAACDLRGRVAAPAGTPVPNAAGAWRGAVGAPCS